MSVRKFYGFYLECPFKVKNSDSLRRNVTPAIVTMYLYINVE